MVARRNWSSDSPAMVLAMTNQTQIHQDRNDDGNQVDSVKSVASVQDPGVDDGCQRKKEEPESEEQQRVVRALEEVGQKEQRDDRQARESECQQHYQARHERSCSRIQRNCFL